MHGHEPFVGTVEVAHFLGTKPSWIYNNAHKAGIPRYQLGNLYKYRLSEVAEWLLTQTVPAR